MEKIMALPKLKHPIYEIEIPGEKEKYKARSMLVREEKLLLMAKEAGKREDFVQAIMQVVNNCVSNLKSIEELPYYKIEYLFLKLREYSISNVSKLSFRDHDDDKVREFPVDLSKVELKRYPEYNENVDLGDGIVIKLKAPSVKLLTSPDYYAALEKGQGFEYMLVHCIDKIFEKDSVTPAKDVPMNEMLEFIDQIPSKHYEAFKTFFNSLPHLYYEISYTNNNNVKREIKLSTLEDFFIF